MTEIVTIFYIYLTDSFKINAQGSKMYFTRVKVLYYESFVLERAEYSANVLFQTHFRWKCYFVSDKV